MSSTSTSTSRRASASTTLEPVWNRNYLAAVQITMFLGKLGLDEILYLRFGEDLTQSEIADRVGVSQMQVSRLLRRSLQRLRELTEERA